MKLLDILNCSRPVLFYNDIYEYPYSFGGTAFVATFRGRHFVITAKHVLNLAQFDASQFRVQYHPDRPDTVPLQAVNFIRGADTEDTDQYDLAIWEAEPSLLKLDLFANHPPVSLMEMDRFTIYNATSDFLYRGFPFQGRTIDYAGRKVQHAALSGRGSFDGRATSVCLIKLRLASDPDVLTDADGLSGSPVFQVFPTGEKTSDALFAGILLRGNTEIAYMLEHRRIFEILTNICDGRAVPAARIS